MVWLISIILVIILYLGIYWLYNRYKEDIIGVDKQIAYIQKKISEMKRKEMINAKLINWLYDELTRKNLLNLEKEKENKDEKK